MAQPIQQYTIPFQNTPVINEDGTMNIAWYRFFQAVWQRSGLATPGLSLYGLDHPTVNVAAPGFWVSTLDFPPALEIVNVRTGDFIGKITMD